VYTLLGTHVESRFSGSQPLGLRVDPGDTMITRKRAIRIATVVSFTGLVVMSLVIEAYKFDIGTHIDIYLGFLALGGVSLVLAWLAFADLRRDDSDRDRRDNSDGD
jgi:hypothetical protein